MERIVELQRLKIWKDSFCMNLCEHEKESKICRSIKCPVLKLTVEQAKTIQIRDLLNPVDHIKTKPKKKRKEIRGSGYLRLNK